MSRNLKRTVAYVNTTCGRRSDAMSRQQTAAVQETQKQGYEKKLRKPCKQQYIANLSNAPKTKQFWSAIKSLNRSNSTRVPTLSYSNNTETITDDKRKLMQ
jgi:hypothetical protein